MAQEIAIILSGGKSGQTFTAKAENGDERETYSLRGEGKAGSLSSQDTSLPCVEKKKK